MTTAAHLACRRLDLAPVLWTCWGEDWRKRATPRSVEKAVLRDLHGGGTILLHDSDCTSATGSWRTTLRALPRILDVCQEHDWQVGPLREHGVPGLPGAVSDGHHLSHPVNGRAERGGRGSVSTEATS